jgi:hypothetical protein
MSGWLVQATVREAGADPVVGLFAAWVPDQMDAAIAVERAVNATDFPAADALCELPDEVLTGLGLKEGELTRLRALS